MADQQINISLNAQEIYQALEEYPEAQEIVAGLIKKAVRSQVKQQLWDNLVEDATKQVLEQILPDEAVEQGSTPNVEQAERQLKPKRIQQPKRILSPER